MDPKTRPLVEIWTDGGARPNPGIGGWAAILRFANTEKELSGAAAETTNNRMELTAAVAALEALRRPCRVILSTDSRYLALGISSWLAEWQKRNWRNASGQPVLNRDLWQRLVAAGAPHEIEWRWIRGHRGNALNERVDRLAAAARDRIEQS